MKRSLQITKYILADLLSAIIAWGGFFAFRKYFYQQYIPDFKRVIFTDERFYLGLFIIPLMWIAFYTILGHYKSIFRKSRIKEIGQTFIASIIGVLTIFFAIVLDDYVKTYTDLYIYAAVLFSLHFFFTALFRFILTTNTVHKIHNKEIGFNTLLIGGNGRATELFLEMENEYVSSGNKFVGFLNVNKHNEYMLSKHLPHLGNYKDAKEVIEEYQIEEVIIAIDPSEHKSVDSIITLLEETGVVIKIIPDMHNILLGSVKMTAIFQAPLIQVVPDIMPLWQKIVKRLMDIMISILALIILSPVFLFVAIGVKLSSPGPIFYSHKRIGYRGKAFDMVKFRTMFQNAESDGTPKLSSKDDPRITKFGLFLRKVRLDEIPQFYTVLKGDMALVGYRPERQYFIDKISEKVPHYKLLLKIKPGITSWGQVKYGYAENVDEMVQRLKYDILYVENMTIAMDIKILFYTVWIVMMGRGK